MSLLIPLIATIVGILCGEYLNGPIYGFIPVVTALCTYILLLRKIHIPVIALKLNRFHSIWIFLLFLGLGLFSSWYHSVDSYNNKFIHGIEGGTGEVTDVNSYASQDRIKVKVSNLVDNTGKITTCRNFKVILNTNGFSTKKGDVLLFKCKFSPIVDNQNYRDRGYAARMQRMGYHYTSIVDPDNLKIKRFNGSLFSKSSLWRDRIERALEKSSLERSTVDFLIAFLLGDKSFIHSDIKEAFSNSGVAHVLALSGMHVAIIMGILLVLLFPLSLLGWYVPRYWVAVVGIWLYAFFTGLAPSTVRACIMAIFVVLSMTVQRKRNAGNALLAACLVILLMDPSAVYDVGLQLSFLSVASILLFVSQLNPINRHLHPRLHLITSSILVSLVATLSTWVLVSYYFKRIPILFLPANLLILPLLPAYMSVALAYTVLLIIGYDVDALSWILNHGYELFIMIIDNLSCHGNYTLDFRATLPMVLLWIIGVLVLGYALNRQKKFIAIVVSVLMFVGSIVITPFLTSPQKDTILFQKKYREISMMLYQGESETRSCFPRNSISRLKRRNSEILSIDCSNITDSLSNSLLREKNIYRYGNYIVNGNQRKRYLLLSSGFEKMNLKDIPGIENFDKIILHSSFKKKKEQLLIKEAKELGLKTLHSLRMDGPLEIEM